MATFCIASGLPSYSIPISFQFPSSIADRSAMDRACLKDWRPPTNQVEFAGL
jgi:hypothetical protein